MDLLTVLEEDESRHCANRKRAGDVRELVNVHLVEVDVLICLGEILDLWGNCLAGT